MCILDEDDAVQKLKKQKKEKPKRDNERKMKFSCAVGDSWQRAVKDAGNGLAMACSMWEMVADGQD